MDISGCIIKEEIIFPFENNLIDLSQNASGFYIFQAIDKNKMINTGRG